MKLRVNEKRVEWYGGHFELSLSVREAIRLGERILVIHDYMAYPPEFYAPNLIAYSLTGERLWIAENLKDACGGADAYVEFISEEPLWVWNFACFRCRIDPETGKLLETEFTK